MKTIFDVEEYIEKTLNSLNECKDNEVNFFYDFDVTFKSKNDFEFFKKNIENKNHKVKGTLVNKSIYNIVIKIYQEKERVE